MKKTSVYNNISARLLKEVDKTLGKNETVEFHLIAKRQNPMMPGRWKIPMMNIPSTDIIYDPYDNEYKEIAYIKKLLPNDGFELEEILVSEQNRPIPGAITIRGDRPKDRELYIYLYLSNYWDRVDRDEDKDLILKLERPGEKAKESTDNRKKMVEAVAFATSMKDTDVRAFAASKGRDPELAIEVLRDFVEENAVNDPAAFLHEAKSNRTSVKATINRAKLQKHIYWDASSSSWKWSATKEQIVAVPRNRQDREDYFASFIIEHENGPSVLGSLESLLS